MCFYQIAVCLEDLGELEKAKANYLKAIEYDDEDYIRLGGYASFLYLYGNSEEALDAYLKLLQLEKRWRFDVSNIMIAIRALAQKIGLNDQEIMKLINND